MVKKKYMNNFYPLNDIHGLTNLKDLINNGAEKFEDQTAFSFSRKKGIINISYKQLKHDVDGLGTAFCSSGLYKCKIAVIGENSYEWIVTYFAAVNGGNTIVPIDKDLSPENIKNIVDSSGIVAIMYSDTYSDIAQYLHDKNADIKHYWNMKTDFPNLISKGQESILNGNDSFINYQVDNNALAAIIYTSGTTGLAKGVMLSHKNLATDAVASWKNVWIAGSSMLVLPLHHTFAFTTSVLCMLHNGRKIGINQSLKNVSKDLETFKPQNMFVVPLFIEMMYKKIWDTAQKSGKDKLLRRMIKVSNMLLKIGIDLRPILFKQVLSALGGDLEILVTGAAPISDKYVKEFRDFGINILNGYGITECSPVVSVNRNRHYKDGSVGLPLCACKVKIVDDEIYVKGDIVMLGYHNSEQATNDAFDGEWFKTGDLGYIDEDGFLFITGRKKNLIILSNGKNVNPEELEGYVEGIEEIKEIIVYAKDDVITAEIYPDFEVDDYQKLINEKIHDINKSLPIYKQIGKIIYRETEFEKTTTKKIKRM